LNLGWGLCRLPWRSLPSKSKRFFFEKKNQKLLLVEVHGATPRISSCKSFCFFFQKEALSFLGATTMQSRRGFVMSSLLTGFTLAATRAEAEAIHTDSAGLIAGEISVNTAHGTIPAYRAQPDRAGTFPIILVIEEIFGVHEYIQDICRRLAKLGYMAIAPELYARFGDFSKMTNPQEIVQKIILKAPDDIMLNDLDSTLTWAVAHRGDTTRIGVMGFCRGGRDTWLYAEHNPYLRAAVAFYGPVRGPTSPIQPRTPLDAAAELKCPLLAMYGGADDSIDMKDVDQAVARAAKSGIKVETQVFPGAPHGFHADYRATYRPEAAEAAWAHALSWFKKYGVN
jgi:carboxymethylenebutenolidase